MNYNPFYVEGKMKKYIAVIIVMVMLVTAVACQGQGQEGKPSDKLSSPSTTSSETITTTTEHEMPKSSTPTTPQKPTTTTTTKKQDTLQAKLEDIVDASGIKDIRTGRQFRQIRQEDVAFFIGAESFEDTFKECVALDPEIDIDPFVLGLFELEEGANASAFAKKLYDNANLNKWVCVTAEDKYAGISGPYVLFIMASKADIGKIARTAGFGPFAK